MLEDKELRAIYGETLIELARENNKIMVLDADLLKANGTILFFKEFPERTLDLGVAEANMMGVAAGLSVEGFIPFANSFAPFASRRSFDQVFLSIAYAGLNVKIGGTDPGLSAELNGGTHMCVEDIGLMRLIPNITIIEPPDGVSMKALLPQVAAQYGPAYIRIFRKKPDKIYEDGDDIRLGKANILNEGRDVAIFCSGMMVQPSLEAAELLKKEGISAKVVNIHTIKPIDENAIFEAARETGAVVTAENHSVVNGLGSAVADILAYHCPRPMRKIGVQDHFCEVGYKDFLMKKFHMTPEDIVRAAKEVLIQKNSQEEKSHAGRKKNYNWS